MTYSQSSQPLHYWHIPWKTKYSDVSIPSHYHLWLCQVSGISPLFYYHYSDITQMFPIQIVTRGFEIISFDKTSFSRYKIRDFSSYHWTVSWHKELEALISPSPPPPRVVHHDVVPRPEQRRARPQHAAHHARHHAPRAAQLLRRGARRGRGRVEEALGIPEIKPRKILDCSMVAVYRI